MLRSLKSNQRNVRVLHCQIDGAGGILSFGGVSGELSLTVNGAGDYTISVSPAFGQELVAFATVVGADDTCYLDNKALGSVDILTSSAGHQFIDVIIVGSDAQDEV